MFDVTQLPELKYPFATIYEFYNSYAFTPPALHLLVAHFLILSFAAYFLWITKNDRLFGLASLGLALNLARNPSFSFGFIDLPESVTLIFLSLGLFKFLFLRIKFKLEGWHVAVLGILVLVCLHSIFCFVYYDLGNNSEFGLRLLLLLRLFFTFFSLAYLIEVLPASPQRLRQFKFALLGILVIASTSYAVQMLLFFGFSRVPFGTWASAGFGGMRFGSISVEGGHLSRAMFPLLLSFIVLRPSKKEILLYVPCCVLFFTNVSASGYSFALVFFLIFILAGVFFKFPRFNRYLVLGLTNLSIVTGLLILVVWQHSIILEGLVNKFKNAFRNMLDPVNDIYGRSPAVIPYLIEKVPVGTGYGGSSQRNVALRFFPELEKYGRTIDLGLNAFVSQLSLLGIPVALLIFFMLLNIGSPIMKSHQCSGFQKVLGISALATFVCIFFIDILWGSPLLWLIPAAVYISYSSQKSIQPYVQVG